MRKKRPETECRGDSNSRVRGVQSTQLHFQPDWFTPHGGATERKIDQSAGAAEPRNQPLSKLRRREVGLAQDRADTPTIQSGGSKDPQHCQQGTARHTVGPRADPIEEGAPGQSCREGTTSSILSGCALPSGRSEILHHATPKRVSARKRSLQRSASDDTNKNALAPRGKADTEQAPIHHRFLNQDNSAAKSLRHSSSRTNERKPACSRSRGIRGQETDAHRVIALPPNSILKITSRSALDVEKHQHKDKADETVCWAQSVDKPCPKSKRSTICSKQLNTIHSTAGHGTRNRSQRGVNRSNSNSNSSRYRVTPCPTAASSTWWSGPASAASRPTGCPTSPGCTSSMSDQPLSAPPTDGLFNNMSSKLIGAATAKSSTTSKSTPKRPYTRRSSTYNTRSEGSSRLASIRRRRGRCKSATSSNDSSRGLLFDDSSSLTTRPSSPGGSKRSRVMTPLRGSRSRTVSGLHRRKSSRTSSRRVRRASRGKRRRGRPRGSSSVQKSKALRGKSWGPVASPFHSAKGGTKSFGLLDRVSNLWRSYSSSRKPGRQSNSSSCSSCSDTSWVARMLPGRRRQQDQKSLKSGRARKAQEVESEATQARRPRRLRASDSVREKSSRKENRPAPSVVCRIM